MLVFHTTDEDTLPPEGGDVTITFANTVVRARVYCANPPHKYIILVSGPTVTSVQQLGIILGLKDGDSLELRHEGHGEYSLHQV